MILITYVRAIKNTLLTSIGSIKGKVTKLLKKQYVLLFLKAAGCSVVVLSVAIIHQKNLRLSSENLRLINKVALLSNSVKSVKSEFTLAQIAFNKQLRSRQLITAQLSLEYCRHFSLLQNDIFQSFTGFDQLGTINSFRLLKENITDSRKWTDLLLKDAGENYKRVLAIKN